MPAYSFKERFIPMLMDLSKRQTIRKKRKGQAKKGDTVYLYYGMRTKYCRKIGEGTCIKTVDIEILPDGNIRIDGKSLADEAKDLLAWRDGFRPEGTTIENCKGSSELMFQFWRQTHDLPFIGDIIFWDPK